MKGRVEDGRGEGASELLQPLLRLRTISHDMQSASTQQDTSGIHLQRKSSRDGSSRAGACSGREVIGT